MGRELRELLLLQGPLLPGPQRPRGAMQEEEEEEALRAWTSGNQNKKKHCNLSH